MKRFRLITVLILLVFSAGLLFAETADSSSKMLILLGHYKNSAGEDIPSNVARDFMKEFVENSTEYSADVFGWYNAKVRDQNESECVAQISATKLAKQQAFDEFTQLHKENWSSDVVGVPADAEYMNASTLGTANPFTLTTNPEAAYTKIGDYKYGDKYFQKMDIYLPKGYGQPGFKPDSVFFYIHGGGWRTGDKMLPYSFSALFADLMGRTNSIFITVNYRSYPDVTIEGELNDVSNAVKKGIDLVHEHGIDAPVNISGASAGGYFTSMLFTDRELLGDYYQYLNDGFPVAPGNHVKKYLDKASLPELPVAGEGDWEDVVDIFGTAQMEKVDPFSLAGNMDPSKHLYIYQGALDEIVPIHYTDEYVSLLPENSYTYSTFANSTHASEELVASLFDEEFLKKNKEAYDANMSSDPVRAAMGRFIMAGRNHRDMVSNCLVAGGLGDAFYTAAGEVVNQKIAGDPEFDLASYSKYLMLIITDDATSGETYTDQFGVTKYFISAANFEAELEELGNILNN